MSGSEVALSLGSNLGDRRGHLARALRRLADRGLLWELEVSGLWETDPVEVAGAQAAYLNACAVGTSALSPEDLLAACQDLEREAGREPNGHRRPRTLDLDLLWHGAGRRRGPALNLPHPGLARRRFVLAPLVELRPEWRHPESRLSVREMLAALEPGQTAVRLAGGKDWWREDA
ncbi:MAG: 2-amino-4-hydroxy-6-hydroxymethyldihydropteridine diphosphokinase [Candidatus Krumholzibacteriota bacterium]|nr:2-amino-4-hydroxy-6-hydroxymethyldihydropteridine diphosphokinase [Candidatus Krumholzibacteriota bacterium]